MATATLPQLPDHLSGLRKTLPKCAGYYSRRAIAALGNEGDFDDFGAVCNYLTQRKALKPQPFAQAWAEQNPKATGVVLVTFLTTIKSRPVATRMYKVKNGRANRNAVKKGAPILAMLDIRGVQLGNADEPEVMVEVEL